LEILPWKISWTNPRSFSSNRKFVGGEHRRSGWTCRLFPSDR
jgi:hypothetical protein